jgi:Fe2+ or Zn2+ uptake regulation protein
MRQTPQREAILRVLAQSDKPLSVEEIWERMAENRSGVPTIYRNLERFVGEGWVENILGADQTMRFVRCRSKSHHHHLLCESCGKAVEVGNCGIDSINGLVESQTGFRLTRHLLMLYGVCPECQDSSSVDNQRSPGRI